MMITMFSMPDGSTRRRMNAILLRISGDCDGHAVE
jgi:hypothetical protein